MVIALGVWLLWLMALIGASPARPALLTAWIVALGLVVAGAGLLWLADALRRRHGQCILVLTPDSVTFSNANGPVPLHGFSGFELDQGLVRLRLTFWVAGFAQAPALRPPCFKSLRAPDASPVAGGLGLDLWLCNATVDGQRLELHALKDLLYAYLEAAQARHTLAQLFPQVQRYGAAP